MFLVKPQINGLYISHLLLLLLNCKKLTTGFTEKDGIIFYIELIASPVSHLSAKFVVVVVVSMMKSFSLKHTHTETDTHIHTPPLFSFVAGLLTKEEKCSLSTEASERREFLFPRVPMNYLLHCRVFARNVVTYEHEHTLLKEKTGTHTSPFIFP